jgi:hypothetical protein
MSQPAILNFDYLALAFGDPTTTSNPRLKYVDWNQHLDNYSVQNPKSEVFTVPSGVQQSLFSGTRVTTLDATTAFNLTLNPLNTTTYRFTWVAGTNPGFSVNRGLAFSGFIITVTSNTNGTSTFVASGGSFAALLVGDTVFIPGISTGDPAGPFNPLNEGFWTVLSVTPSTIIMSRFPGVVFNSISEAVTQTSNTNIVGYSSAGVQTGDGVDIIAGFSLPVLKGYKLLTITPTFFEVTSTLALPLAAGVMPTAAGMVFYAFAKRFVLVEVDQEASIQLNGDLGQTQRISPWVAADPLQVGVYVKAGIAWSLAVTNRSTSNMSVLLISAE